MSAISVVPPIQATQRPTAESSSVNRRTSTGPFVVGIRTRSFCASVDMYVLYQERSGRGRIRDHAQQTRAGRLLLVEDHHDLTISVGWRKPALEQISPRSLRAASSA